jgi:aspartate oxidase
MRTSEVVPVVVVGSGAAGLMAACVAAERCRTLLVTDRGLGTSNSAVAQGGLQLPGEDASALDRFRVDIERSGGSGVDPARLDRFVSEVRPTIELLESWGLVLDRGPDGELVRRRAGGMSEARVVTAGDRIGSAVLRVLRNRLGAAGVEVGLRSRVDDVVAAEDEFVLRFADGGTLAAHTVVLAVGGGSYERAAATGSPTSNPANRNTALYDAVRRLGVGEVDADLFQYQPYGIVDPDRGAIGKCVPESVVELGATVVDASGNLVGRAGADRRELTAAMFTAIAAGRGEATPSGVRACRLTLGSVDSGALTQQYPHLARTLGAATLPGGDVLVVPVLHYQLGGFRVGPDGSTDVDGLFLAGEMAGGLHGRNRLMGNGITEALVSGRLAGTAAAGRA